MYAEELKMINATILLSEATILSMQELHEKMVAHRDSILSDREITDRVIKIRKLNYSIGIHVQTIQTMQKLHRGILAHRKKILNNLDASYRTAETDAQASINRITGREKGDGV